MRYAEELVHKLFLVNCKYNYKIEKDGKCYCSNCMLNQNEEIKNKIKEQGCIIYKEIEK